MLDTMISWMDQILDSYKKVDKETLEMETALYNLKLHEGVRDISDQADEVLNSLFSIFEKI